MKMKYAFSEEDRNAIKEARKNTRDTKYCPVSYSAIHAGDEPDRTDLERDP